MIFGNYRNILNYVCISLGGGTPMKGRTTCPKCKKEIILDIPDKGKHEVVCPKCNNKFSIQKCDDSESFEECSWEEHGEPRKTVLSAIKPKTQMPMIAAIVLTVVFIIGISTASFSESFIESSLDVASYAGLTGSMKIIVTDQSNNTIENVEIKILNITGSTNSDGVFIADNIELGIHKLEIIKENYDSFSREILITPFLNYESTIKLDNNSVEGKTDQFNSTGCAIILIIFSVIALIGAISCLKRKHIDIAVVSSLIAIFSFGFYLIGSIFAIIAFILIYESKDEFENGKKGKIF
jgi:hypothetical protein